MSKIEEIISYVARHSTSEGVVDRYHDRLLDPLDRAQQFVALKKQWDETYALLPDAATEEAYERMQRTLGRTHGRIGWRLWLRAAALWLVPLVSVVTCAVLGYRLHEVSSVQQMQQFVAMGKRSEVTLPDGSIVVLNSGTTLLYPSRFVGSRREVSLVGEGYFKVKKSDNKPFIVKSHHLNVEVLGTTFNLKAYPDDARTSVTLVEGGVRVSSDDFSKSYILTPHDHLNYDASISSVQQSRVVTDSYVSWVQGGLDFRNEPFDQIMRQIERTYDVQVLLLNSAYKKNRLTFSLNENESLPNTMRLIKQLLPTMEYQIVDDRIYVE